VSTQTTSRPGVAPPPRRRLARGGTLVLGGGFGGAHVARLVGKDGATIVSPEGSMLYTPLLPEVAAGALEARHAVVPLRQMCPDAEIVRGRAVGLDEDAHNVMVETELGPLEIGYERLVIALGSVARMPELPGLAEHGLPFKHLDDAMVLRNHVLHQLDLAEADPARAERRLTFVFVGAGYAGVEALAELQQLVREALRHYPALRDVPQRWVLVDGGPGVLAETPPQLARYTERLLRRRGVELRLGTRLREAGPDAVTLSDGTVVPTGTLVWTAGVTPNPVLRELGLPLDERGRVRVDERLRVHDRDDVWALGDGARVPNAGSGELDPPTCQHALRQARRVVKSLQGSRKPYRYRSLGGGATLGRDKGIAAVLGLRVRGVLGGLVIRAYHLHQVPLASRRIRVIADSAVARLARRDIADLGAVELAIRTGEGA
jgi:NADH:ubiquinone reductase (H+-translocating)